jgi:pantoate--beta-alanine ligase
MQIFTKVKEIQDYLTKFNTRSVGFVATMGALHNAHVSLIEKSKQQNDLTVCSIFVNPKQFNKKEDLNNYPRDIEADLLKLKIAKCNVVFIPSEGEMYPKSVKKQFNFGILSEVMEAKHRPGHFNGVAIVIERFFEILKPTRAYFGMKDYQQLAVIKALVKEISSSVKIIGCPIYREENGLAMSSRNARLTKEEKELAGEINKGLNYIRKHKNSYSIQELKEYFMNKMLEQAKFEIEYIEIADEFTLKPIENWEDAEKCIVFAAVNVNGIRLIDNMTINN